MRTAMLGRGAFSELRIISGVSEFAPANPSSHSWVRAALVAEPGLFCCIFFSAVFFILLGGGQTP